MPAYSWEVLRGRKSSKAAGGGKKRKRNSKAAAGGWRAATKGKKLYSFIHHNRFSPNGHSLYAFKIPNPSGGSSSKEGGAPGERVNIDPVLRFSTKEWPSVMAAAFLGSKLYLMGGYFGGFKPPATYPTSVHTLDLSSPKIKRLLKSGVHRDQPGELMERVADMHTGKVNPLAFVADGKVYVLSGMDRGVINTAKVREIQNQFEVYCPNKDEWEVLPNPPFHDIFRIGAIAVVGRKVIVYGPEEKSEQLFFSFHLDSKTWWRFNPDTWTKLDNSCGFQFSLNSQFVGNTLYSLARAPKGIAIVPLKKKQKPPPPPPPPRQQWQLRRHKEEEEEGGGGKEEEEEDINYLYVHKEFVSSPTLTTTLTHIRDGLFCSLQVGAPWASTGHPRDFNGEECLMTLTVFRVIGEGDSGEYLNSANYTTFPDLHNFMTIDSFIA